MGETAMSKKLYYNGTILTMDDSCPRADYVLKIGRAHV